MVARLRKRGIVIPAVAVLVVLIAVGLFLFQPWKLFTSSTVNEALVPAQQSAASTGNTLVGQGEFRSLEHPTTGRAELVTLPDGSHIVQLRDFRTSDGPDVHVWISDNASS